MYLFEPGFETVCLVMGQGAERLEQAVGKKRALTELQKRAARLRAGSTTWQRKGFNEGPFNTTRDNAAKRINKGDTKIDPWATSVAFGKRYSISAMPTETVLREDLNQMLEIYCDLVKRKTLEDAALDGLLADMAMTDSSTLSSIGNWIRFERTWCAHQR